MSDAPALGVEPRTRDALAVLAHVYLQFARADDAAALLRVLALIEGAPGWAAATHCLALLMAGHAAEAREAAGQQLRHETDDVRRCQLLRVLARACWNVGLAEEARAHQAALRELQAATVMHRNGAARR